jgi:error-prone DNA polymerase
VCTFPLEFGDGVLARADEGRTGSPEVDGRDLAEARRRQAAQRQARAALPSGRNFH